MPTVMIYQSPRAPAARASAIVAVTQALVASYHLQPQQIHVDFHEVPDDSRGRGGVLASDRGQQPAPGSE
jgi:phenylpyruvate tautomerase PptA (4-oxalocrotonate tautomerase family)